MIIMVFGIFVQLVNFKHIAVEILDARLLIVANQFTWRLAMNHTRNDHLCALNLFDWIHIVARDSVQQRLVKAVRVQNDNVQLNILKCQCTIILNNNFKIKIRNKWILLWF